MALHWYLKKEYWDTSDDIEWVGIHYTWVPFGQAPDWNAHRESRFMPAGEELRTGVGLTGKALPPYVPQQIHHRLRKKILKMPNDIWDEAAGVWTGEYNLHYYYEVLQRGERSNTPVYTDEIRTREVILLSPNHVISGSCAYWSVSDWDAPQFSPTEDPRFVSMYGEDSPLRSFKLYGTPEHLQDSFSRAKKALVDKIPLPHRFTARISAPVGMPVRLRFHVGQQEVPGHASWEDYWLDEMFIMAPGLEPFVCAPMGSEITNQYMHPTLPLDWLRGNPYAHLVPGFAG
jgi:hypothetical protein